MNESRPAAYDGCNYLNIDGDLKTAVLLLEEDSMRRVLCIGVASIVCGALVLLSADAVRAGTIIKLNLGGDNSTDIAYDGTHLSTLDDLGPSPGNQDTGVDFLDILSHWLIFRRPRRRSASTGC